MTTKSNKPKAKAKEQKAVSRAVKQAGFKNIKEAKLALREANKKIKTKQKSPATCWKDDDDCCGVKTACSAIAPAGAWRDLNDVISCKYKFDPAENCDILTIKIKY